MTHLVLTMLLYSGAVKATIEVPYTDMAACQTAATQQVRDAKDAGAVVVFSGCRAFYP